MTEQDFAEKLIILGRKIHKNQNTYWLEQPRFFCRPVFIYKIIEKGSSKPKFFKCPIGYMHRVATKREANFERVFIVMDKQTLGTFSLKVLPKKRRNIVRRSLEFCEIQKLQEIAQFLEDLRQINISTSFRQMNYGKPEVPPERYLDERKAWEMQILKEFSVHESEWWGAFVREKLVAYMRLTIIERIVIIRQVRSHSEYLKYKPVDALYFTVLSELSNRGEYEMVVNGTPLRSSLDHFKEQYLFKKLPLYWYISPLAFMFRKVQEIKRWTKRL